MVEKSKPTAAAERLESLPKRPGKASFAITILWQSDYPSFKVLLAVMVQLNFSTLCCWELLCHVQCISISVHRLSVWGKGETPFPLLAIFSRFPQTEPVHRLVHSMKTFLIGILIVQDSDCSFDIRGLIELNINQKQLFNKLLVRWRWFKLTCNHVVVINIKYLFCQVHGFLKVQGQAYTTLFTVG